MLIKIWVLMTGIARGLGTESCARMGSVCRREGQEMCPGTPQQLEVRHLGRGGGEVVKGE